MMLVDINLLLYAHDPAAAQHRRAKAWLEQALSGQQFIGLAWVTILAFLRITTHARAPKPMSLAQATAAIEEWLVQPSVSIVHPGDGHWKILSHLLPESQARGALVTDAHLAALALEHGATLCTNDRDFARFRGLRIFNPLDG